MKNKINKILSRPFIVVLVMVFAPFLNYFDRNFSFFFALSIVLLILWSSNYKWLLFGFTKKPTKKTILYSLILTAVLIIIDNCFSILVRSYFGEPNLSSLDDIKHNTANYIFILIVVWSFVAFGEEFLFRGYYMKWLAEFLGNSNKAWIASAIIISIYFGMSHYYQGISGIISIFFLTLISSMIFYKNRNNLWLLILIHGFHDTWGLTFLYLDMLDPIAEWLEQVFVRL